MSSTPISLFALAIALALAYASGQATHPDRDAFFLDPSRWDANASFKLDLLSYRYDCGVTYSDHSVNRQGNRVDLRFVAHPKPDAACPLIDKPYGPSFPMPALPAGRYDVHATALAPCQVGNPVCLLPERTERVGILTIGRVADADWFIQPVSVPAGKAFDLRILSDRYGNCQTSFSHVSHSVADNRIRATFVTTTDTNVVCIWNQSPHGPAIKVEPLKAGRYPVDVIEAPSCAYKQPICPWLPPDKVARVVDTLVVTGASSLDRPRPADIASRTRPTARVAGGRLQVDPPGGWGSLQVLDLGGRVVAEGGTDEVYDLAGFRAGIYFLRVASPRGIDLLSLVVKP